MPDARSLPDSEALKSATFKKVAVIGMGLMGGSFAAALKRKNLAEAISGYDLNTDNLVKAQQGALIDSQATSIQQAVEGANLILIAVPVLAIERVLVAVKDSGCLAAKIKPLITDMGSVKSIVIETAIKVFGALPDTLVPGHPIAGSEKHGVQAADPDLFSGHKVILTPAATTSADALKAMENLWQHLGSEVIQMDAAHHDQVLAQTSHLPHLLAYTLVDTLSNQPDGREIFQYAAGGFRDFSRIAASDPTMWRDIFKANREPVLEILEKFTADLESIKELIRTGQTDVLAEKFARAKEARDYFSQISHSRTNNARANDIHTNNSSHTNKGSNSVEAGSEDE